MNEENKDDLYDRHVTRYEKKLKVGIALGAVLIVYIVWFMLNQ